MSRLPFDCPLRWSDMDSAGHVRGTAYFRFLEESRIDLMWRSAKEGGLDLDKFNVVVAQHEMHYRRPLRYRPEPVEVSSWLSRLGKSSYDFAYEIRDVDVVYARAVTTSVAVDPASGRSRPLRPEERTALGVFAADEPVEYTPIPDPLDVHPVRHELPLHVRRSDMDAIRHVNNVVYVAYAEDARAELFAGYPELAALAEHSAVARHRVQYVRPLLFGNEPVRITSWVSRVGESAVTVHHEVADAAHVYCRITSVVVPFDAASQRSRPLTPAEHAVLTGLAGG